MINKKNKIIMSNDKLIKFKEVWKSEVAPRIKKKNKLDSERDKLYPERDKLDSEIDKLNSERDKLDSEIDKLDSERDKLYPERNKLDSERDKLNSEIDKLYSERDKLDSERDKLNSEIDKLYSEILMIFYNFGKESSCVVNWRNYGFKFEETELKEYNTDKTGFVFTDMKGKTREELFEKKPEKFKVIDGHKYALVEDN